MSAKALQPGFAVAALVLGIVSIVFSLVVVGALLGLIGLVLGTLSVRRNRDESRGMAVTGLVLSGVGVVASAGFAALYFLVFSTMFSGAGSAARAAALLDWQGVAAPDFTITTLDGDVLQLSALRGRRVVVDFWATWCGPCIHEVPHLNRLVQENSGDDLIVIGISREPRPVIEPFVAEHAMTYPVASATDLPAPYSQLPGIPTKFFIDRNGVIRSVSFGSGSFDALAERALADDYLE